MVSSVGSSFQVPCHENLEYGHGPVEETVQKTKKYLWFGEASASLMSLEKVKTVAKVAAIAGCIIGSCAAIGFAIGNIPGAIIGAGVAGGAILLAGLVYAAFTHSKRYLFNRALPPQQHDLSSPQLGAYYRSDLRIATTADEGFEWKKSVISSAEQSIELSANFAGGKEFQEVLALIRHRMEIKPNLRVHMIMNPETLEPEDKKELQSLRLQYKERFTYLLHGPTVHVFPALHTEENHVKVLVVDGTYFVTGGSGIHPMLSRENTEHRTDVARLRSIGASALESATRDNDIIGKSDDIASVMRRQFFSLFRICEMHVKNAPANDRFFPVEKSQQGSCQEFHTKKGLFERVRMKVIVGGPEHGIDNPITRQYVTRINKAWRSISFANMQFNPAKTIVDALKNTRKNSRKINIQVLTNGVNGKTCLGRRVQVMVSRRRYCLADTVCEYQRPKTIFHKKVAVFDGSHTVIGSYNLGKKSSGYDTEMVCVIKDKAVARSFEKVLREDVKQSKTLIRKEILRRKFGDTVLGSLVSFTERFL